MQNKLLYIILFIAFMGINSELSGNDKRKNIPSALFGTLPEPVIYTGMWTCHFRDRDSCNWKNNAFGFEYNGYFLATLKNTYYKQCYTSGITRNWYHKKINKDLSFSIGYRVGGIYGYDKQLKSISNIAEKYKILPYAQVYTHIIIKKMRFEFSYINQLVSLHLSILLKRY